MHRLRLLLSPNLRSVSISLKCNRLNLVIIVFDASAWARCNVTWHVVWTAIFISTHLIWLYTTISWSIFILKFSNQIGLHFYCALPYQFPADCMSVHCTIVYRFSFIALLFSSIRYGGKLYSKPFLIDCFVTCCFHCFFSIEVSDWGNSSRLLNFNILFLIHHKKWDVPAVNYVKAYCLNLQKSVQIILHSVCSCMYDCDS